MTVHGTTKLPFVSDSLFVSSIGIINSDLFLCLLDDLQVMMA